MTHQTEAMQALEKALAQAREEALVRQTRRDQLQQLLNEAQSRLAETERQRELFDRVKVLLQESAEHARMQAKVQLEGLVTNALQYVFGPLFRFEIELSDHGGKPVAEFFVVTDWEGTPVKTKPQEARGGGIVDITSLALRVAMIETFRPRPEGPLILDEPGKHVSAEYVVPMLEFLQSVSGMFGRQVILVTHNNHLTEGADQAFEVALASGETRVRPVGLLDNGTG
jgi:DNA repair exonuclease SbcCD ATPase subunit